MRLSRIVLSLVLIGCAGALQARPKSSKSKPRPAKAAKVVKGGKSAKAVTAGSVYKVQKGDTATKIAKAHGMSVSELAELNPKVRVAHLAKGTILKVRSAARALPEVESRPEVNDVSASPAVALLAPVATLPAIPAQAPATLLHLERVLPENVMKKAPAAPVAEPRDAAAEGSRSSLATTLPLFVPVLRPGTGVEYESQQASDLGFHPVDPSQIDLLWPVETRTVSSAWGPRIRSRSTRIVKASVRKRVKVRYRSTHKGVDLTAPVGTDVYAALDGKVLVSGRHKAYGNYIIVDHGNGVQTLYAHHVLNIAREGDLVRRGQKIAEVGRTGNATGPHLHFELIQQGLRHNPIPFLNDVEEIPAEMMAFNNAASTQLRRR